MIIAEKCNNLTGKEWLKNSISVWQGPHKTKEEKAFGHPASYPVALCEQLIQTFSRDGKIIDPFSGIGSTMVAAQNLHRPGLGIDLSEKYCDIARQRVANDSDIKILCGDCYTVLDGIASDSFNLCITSPPYWDILNRKHSADTRAATPYSNQSNDYGNITDYTDFLSALGSLFEKMLRVLKSGSYCLVNVMDLRKKNRFYPLHSDLSLEMQRRGYIYDDLIIWNRQSEYNNLRPLGYPYKFRINKIHEYILIFIKP